MGAKNIATRYQMPRNNLLNSKKSKKSLSWNLKIKRLLWDCMKSRV